jgi:hypothetical protein
MNFELPEEPLILILLQRGSEAFNRWSPALRMRSSRSIPKSAASMKDNRATWRRL